ncbi:MAG TPA: hypothetical protein PKW69_03680 [Niabella sp.]|nr:hypothetical protein [Niabella sp.]
MKKIALLFVFGSLAFVANAQEKENFISKLQPEIQYTRPGDKTGMNVFETSKDETVPYEGLKVKFGAGFTQQFQTLTHTNSGAVPLYPRLAPGFGVAMANLMMDVQLADGIKLNLETYLSSRHHNESWVKGGYLQLDKLPFKGEFWDNLMKNATIKLGHMGINYGDQHFRRSDGGNTIFNPFAENYIMDAFATEVAGEFYLKNNGLLGMVGISNGLINGGYQHPQVVISGQTHKYHRNPSIYAKGAIDKNIGDLRVRGAASIYYNASDGRSTLYGGDRTGSNYFFVMEGATANAKDNAFSGRVDPGLTNQIRAIQLNGFMKFHGLELFGTYENAKGRNVSERFTNSPKRNVNQIALDAIYRLGAKENVYIGGRYNTVNGQLLASSADKQSVNRIAIGGGWFLTKNILLKAEYVDQKFNDYPSTSIFNKGGFKGGVVEAVIGF